jgi:hypothetical protein
MSGLNPIVVIGALALGALLAVLRYRWIDLHNRDDRD